MILPIPVGEEEAKKTMSISTMCPECFTPRTVKNEFRGKRVRCQQCQAVYVADDMGDPAEAIAVDESDFSPPAKHRKPGRAPLNALQRFLIFAVRNPWAGMTLFFLGVWVPVSLFVTKPLLVIDVVLMLVCMLGCVVGILLAFGGVAMKNPFQILTAITVGALAAQIVPAEAMPAVGRSFGNAMKGNGQAALGDADTGTGGQLAVYCGMLVVVLLAHITILSFVLVSRQE